MLPNHCVSTERNEDLPDKCSPHCFGWNISQHQLFKGISIFPTLSTKYTAGLALLSGLLGGVLDLESCLSQEEAF